MNRENPQTGKAMIGMVIGGALGALLWLSLFAAGYWFVRLVIKIMAG